MWAAQTNWRRERIGKYHWFKKEVPVEPGSMRGALCDPSIRIYPAEFIHSKRKQPRHADRCKRCAAALERRKDENADGCV